MAYPMYNNNNQLYMQDLQAMKDRIDSQMRQIQQSQQQQQQMPQPITQNFQLAPNPTNSELESKYAENIEQVRNTFVVKTGVFMTKDFGTLWIKDVTGNIRTFKTEEIIEIDEKDREILMLKKQIEEMKEMISYANESDNADVDEQIATKKSSRVQSSKRTNAKQ